MSTLSVYLSSYRCRRLHLYIISSDTYRAGSGHDIKHRAFARDSADCRIQRCGAAQPTMHYSAGPLKTLSYILYIRQMCGCVQVNQPKGERILQ